MWKLTLSLQENSLTREIVWKHKLWTWFSENEVGRGQRPFGTFPKIHSFWLPHAFLSCSDTVIAILCDCRNTNVAWAERKLSLVAQLKVKSSCQRWENKKRMRGCLIYIMQDRPTVVGAESETEVNLVFGRTFYFHYFPLLRWTTNC